MLRTIIQRIALWNYEHNLVRRGQFLKHGIQKCEYSPLKCRNKQYIDSCLFKLSPSLMTVINITVIRLYTVLNDIRRYCTCCRFWFFGYYFYASNAQIPFRIEKEGCKGIKPTLIIAKKFSSQLRLQGYGNKMPP